MLEIRRKSAPGVMTVRNDPGRRRNGSVGTVVAIANDRVSVRLDTGPEVEIDRFTWEKIRYEWDAGSRTRWRNRRGYVHALADRTRLGTPNFYKAQGLTLEDVRVDFDYGGFAPGQAYVAISRSPSMEGLSLVRPMRYLLVTGG